VSTAEEPSSCGACGASLGERQRWCLQCGVATLMAVGSARRWVSAGIAAAVIALLALVGIGYAIAALVSS
jgi:hypothetical protein